MKAPSKAGKAVPMACLSIGFQDFLMPADKAMKVAELMQSAFDCRKDFAGKDYAFTPSDQPRIEFVFLKPHQVRQPAAPQGPRLLEGGRS